MTGQMNQTKQSGQKPETRIPEQRLGPAVSESHPGKDREPLGTSRPGDNDDDPTRAPESGTRD